MAGISRRGVHRTGGFEVVSAYDIQEISGFRDTFPGMWIADGRPEAQGPEAA